MWRVSRSLATMRTPSRDTLLGWTLVSIQGLLFVGIAFWPQDWSPEVYASLIPALVLIVLGAAGMVASALHLGGALTPLPTPNGAGLSARGVYGWARHPMYTAVVVICVGVALGRGLLVVWVLVGALTVLFEVKTRVEERYLTVAYDGYAEYAARTGKFVPGLRKRTTG